MSEIDRDFIPSREEERLLKRALGCAIPDFITRFGAAGAVKRVEAELRRARRARSRKLYAFWSAVLAQIDPACVRGHTKLQEAGRSEIDHDQRRPDGDRRCSPIRDLACVQRAIGLVFEAIPDDRLRDPGHEVLSEIDELE